jgi:Fe-S oxidoreductase
MTFEKNYPELGLELVHSTQFLSRMGNIKLRKSGMRVAFHDPCHLGRELGIYQEPRKILKEVADVKEMRRKKEQAWCCGSGGGVKSAFDDLALWSARERIKEAEEAGAEALIVACPFCKRNLREAVENGMKVFDVVELVNLSLEG